MAASISGVAGNIISSLVFLAPVPTFLQVYREKTTGGFSSVPYVVALFSSVLWIEYALVKTNSRPLLTINALGGVMEAVYIVVYLVYAPRKARLRTLAYFLLEVAAFALITAVALRLRTSQTHRIEFLGSVCLAFSMAVFVAPLTIIFKVIKTKSVEFMPITLSFFLTLSAIAWFCYGLFTGDPYVMYPNVGGFFFSSVQMVLYFWYRNSNKNAGVLPTTTSDSISPPASVAVDSAATQRVIELLGPAGTQAFTIVSMRRPTTPILGVNKVVEVVAPPPEEQPDGIVAADKEQHQQLNNKPEEVVEIAAAAAAAVAV
ncbi:hypothetical protein GUJ93_ZPchr0010g9765 [Zizania palustris]|uniref:Bidirectional sugar transporter SWEET n=1 Tax=Zizania palustris TaxID=103762 RepID=A0A8J5WCA2_ZIZPA|nr:hypothetical protein GUJ93_ZPchr0010g9765 [Zizania palustris]